MKPGPIGNILFVCTGNICRSPFAHRLCLKRMTEKGIVHMQVDSAGVTALPGNHATVTAQRVAGEHAVDLSDHRAKAVTEELAAWADLILVMEKTHERDLLDGFANAAGKVLLVRYFARAGSRRRAVSDPYGMNEEAYRCCFFDIEEAVSGLIAYLENTSASFVPVDVACYDGYRQNESPRSFGWGGKRHAVSRIVDRWYDGSPVGTGAVADYYKVQTEDGSEHILRYDRGQDIWALMVR